MKNKITVGRSDQADVVIDDDTISRLHLELVLQADGSILARDLDSSNGTYLVKSGRIKISEQVIGPEQEIIIGERYKTTPRHIIQLAEKNISQQDNSPFSRYIRSEDGTFKRK